MTIIPLGTNGFFSSFNRQTACFALPYGKTLIILDAGSGLFRFIEPEGQRLLKNADTIHLYLSHYHLDHTFGFYPAFELLKDKNVIVFGKSAKRVFSELTHLEYFPVNFDQKFANFSWKTLTIGEQTIDSYTVTTRKQYHRGSGSLALRFHFPKENKTLAYITDTEANQESVTFIGKADLLLHEHGVTGEELLGKNAHLEDHFGDGHVTTVGAVLVAKHAMVKQLALIHHHPINNNQQLASQLRLAKTIFPNTILSSDLLPIEY